MLAGSDPGADHRLDLVNRPSNGELEGPEFWDDGLVLDEIDLVEVYRQGRLGIWVYFKSGVPKGSDNRPTLRPREVVAHVADGPDLTGPVRLHNYAILKRCDTENGRQDGVLIDDIAVMEGAEDLSRTTFVSTEFDEDRLGVGACYYSFNRSFVTSLVPLEVDGEFRFGTLLTAVNPHEFPKRMVKGRMEIVDGVPNHQSALCSNLVIECDDCKTTVRVELDRSALRIAVQGDLEIADVLLGPINL